MVASQNNPLIDQCPEDLTNNSGIFIKDVMLKIIQMLKMQSGLNEIYGGYVLIEPPIESFKIIGSTSLIGMNIDRIKKDIDAGKQLILGYIAVPIDDCDNLIENSSLWDWDFQERYLDPLLGYSTSPGGAIGLSAIGRKGESGDRLRTLKFDLDINDFMRP